MIERLEDHINHNKVCPDLIFRDWDEFLVLLFDCGGSVREILWFEYVLIEKQKESMGGGGYPDMENPGYMWAETMLLEKRLEQKSLTEIKAYIENTISSHKPHNLVPCFCNIIA